MLYCHNIVQCLRESQVFTNLFNPTTIYICLAKIRVLNEHKKYLPLDIKQTTIIPSHEPVIQLFLLVAECHIFVFFIVFVIYQVAIYLSCNDYGNFLPQNLFKVFKIPDTSSIQILFRNFGFNISEFSIILLK